jgi:ATP-dependent DNA helicase RecG
VQELERRGSLEGNDRLVLVHAARGEKLTNASARQILGGVDSAEARKALQRLRDAGLLEQRGERGGATYSLAEDLAPPAAYRLSVRELGDLVVAEAANTPMTNARVRELTGLSREQALAMLRRLVQEGRLVQRGHKRATVYGVA